MSLVIQPPRDPIHTPKRRDVFQFDKEVAEIFDNMALRSIPMYAEMHRLHAKIAAEHARRGRRSKHVIVDVGASTGAFFKTLSAEMGFSVADDPWTTHNLRLIAVEPSEPMLEKIGKYLPFVELHQTEGHQLHETVFAGGSGADIVCLHYVLQFVGLSFKELTLRSIFKSLRKNGILFLAQKEAVSDTSHKMVADVLDAAYIELRRDNGYTQEEIDAKTRALRGAMWPLSKESLKRLLFKVGFDRVIETTRWGQFSSWAAIKA